MNRFYIKSIGVSGPTVNYSEIVFDSGVNIVYGSSAFGKSYIIDCIDFMFGSSKVPFSKLATGYDTIHMTMATQYGEFVQMERKIIDSKSSKKSDMGENLVRVKTNCYRIKWGVCKISNLEYSDLLLQLLGIKERHQIISTQSFAQENLTNRSFLNLYFKDENSIYKKGSIFDIPKNSKKTVSLTALHFLFTGNDLCEIIPMQSQKDRELRKEDNNSYVIYINNKKQELANRRKALEKELSEIDVADIELKMDSCLKEISLIENQIDEATEQSRKLLKEGFDTTSQLEEAIYLQDRYKALRTQYKSDIKKLRFIIEGEKKNSHRKNVVKCPFCYTVLQEESEQHIAYAKASQAELSRITMQLSDLKETEKDIQHEINNLETRVQELKKQNNEITQMISRSLNPKAEHLRDMLESYKHIVHIRKELSDINKMTESLNSDAYGYEMGKENDEIEFCPSMYLDEHRWVQWSNTFNRIVKECNYPDYQMAHISLDTYDAIVNWKHKSDESKSYRAFLNSVLMFSLMKTLENNGTFRPAMLILGSPILTQKENVQKTESATLEMQRSLFKYMIDNCGDNQIILFENDMPIGIDCSTAHFIRIPDNRFHGVYDFLEDYSSRWFDF
ncbi:MAG TPA: hypothetical protein GXZ23_04235 [Clostridiales bacterium]|nr:hypothetical protein [Clostridiales bacterium]